MMRIWWLLLLPLAGCFGEPVDLISCGHGPKPVTLYLADGISGPHLQKQPPMEGTVPIGDFTSGFLTDAALPFLSDSLGQGILVEGIMTLELSVHAQGVAPLVIGPDGTGYQLFNQFGSDRTLIEAYAVEFGDPAPGRTVTYVEPFAMPEGGFVVESGDQVRLLLTSLSQNQEGHGHEVVVGPDGSRLTFEARCYGQRTWTGITSDNTPLSLPGNQGLLTGAVPAVEGVNRQTVWFDLDPATERLTIQMEQSNTAGAKDDMDLQVVDEAGNVVYSQGSPAADETLVLWKANLDAFMAPGRYAVLVNSYSGTAYEGELDIVQERAR